MNWNLIRKSLVARGYWEEADADGGKGGGVTTDEGGKKDDNRPSDEVAKLLKENMGKKTKIKELEDQLRRFDGIDPEQVRALLDAEKSRKDKEASDEKARVEKELEERKQWEALKMQMADEHGKQTKALNDQIAALQAQIAERDGKMDDLAVGNAFANSKFVNDELILTPAKARKLYSDHVEVVDGEVVVHDKPKGSTGRAPLVDASGTPLSFDAAIRRLVDADPDKDRIVRAKIKGGAGSNSSGQRTDKVDVDNLRGTERISAALAALAKK